MKPFLTALDERVLVCDGAMGTMLYAKGVFINRCFESLNLSQPGLVVDVHQEYLRAGADVVETNTFGANRMKLRAFGLGDQVREINLAGARLAREAIAGAGHEGYVAGAIGPLGVRIEPWGKTGVDEAEALFREQAQALVDGKVDLFVLETFRDLNEIGAAIKAVRSVCTLPIVAQMTTEEDGASLDGAPPEQFAPALIAQGADVVGVNCSVGPAPMLETIDRISGVTDVWLSAQPNAGRPRDIEGRNLYLCSPEYMASYARRFIESGVRLVGGCCGTTPEHIRQIALAAKSMAPGLARAVSGAPKGVTYDGPRTPLASEPHAQPGGGARRQERHVGQVGARGVRVGDRTGAAAWSRAIGRADRCRPARQAWRGRDHDSRRAALGRAHERAVAGGAGATAHRGRGAAAILVSRPQSARHPVGPARRARDGRAQPARHHRRRAQRSATFPMPRRSSTSIRSA